MNARRGALAAGAALAFVLSPPARADEAAPAVGAALLHKGRIVLPGVAGRIDHLAIDVDRQRLFVAALGNGTLEVIDLRAADGQGARLRSVTGLDQPQGLAYLPSLRRVIVASAGGGGGGSVTAFDDGTFRPLGTIGGLPDADNVRSDAGNGRLYVGYGTGALAVIDPAQMRRLADVKLPGHPEAFALEGGGASIYVNVPSHKGVLIVDRLKGAALSTITLKSAAGNFPMALDEAGHRLFVGTRKPARVVVLDPRDGQVMASFSCVGDADDLFYDAARRRLYVTGGDGFVDAFDAAEGGRYLQLAHVATAPGARTSLWVPQLRRLFVAAPKRGAEPAAIHIFEVPEL
jgi:DNA-binding beta-propeller fold protein YncE